jgi:hypothetical protein
MRHPSSSFCWTIYSAKADLLFRDAHAEHTYRFESDQKSVEMKVTRQEVVELPCTG